MADATVSNTVEGNLVWVRIPPSAPTPATSRGLARSTLDSVARPRAATTEGSQVARAFGLGAAGSGLCLLLFPQVWAFALPGVAGVLAAWLVNERGRGLLGLSLGVAATFAVWGGYEVVRKIQSCQPIECSGLSSPNLTVAIAVGLGVIGLLSAVAGWLAGRTVRVVASRLQSTG
jgi:hypothetical protein